MKNSAPPSARGSARLTYFSNGESWLIVSGRRNGWRRKMEAKSNGMKAIRKLLNGLSTLFVALIVLLAVLLVGVRLVGLTPYTVLSGSMEPTYHVGSLIYVKKVDPAEVKIGDPITFVVNEDLLVATHRVVDIQKVETQQTPVVDEAGQPVLDPETNQQVTQETPLEEPAYYYQTKGDANDAVDGSPVYHKNLIGTPVFTIPLLGYLSSWLQTRQGMIAGVTAALVLVIMMFLPDVLRKADEADQRAAKRKRRKKRKKRPTPPQS